MRKEFDRSELDILGRWRFAATLYWLPIAALVASGRSPNPVRTSTWCGACLVMGIACLINAKRCGRIHCYFTGPFFVLMALLVVAVGSGMISLGLQTWNYLGLALIIGGVGLTYGPEVFLGKYRSR